MFTYIIRKCRVYFLYISHLLHIWTFDFWIILLLDFTFSHLLDFWTFGFFIFPFWVSFSVVKKDTHKQLLQMKETHSLRPLVITHFKHPVESKCLDLNMSMSVSRARGRMSKYSQRSSSSSRGGRHTTSRMSPTRSMSCAYKDECSVIWLMTMEMGRWRGTIREGYGKKFY